ncbi:cation:proton antiporter family protein [Labilibaculum antarcticum]|uniref:Potassium transporter Kef n=1 Tax=Labilibaculum antarcticum TaxID=1717717 RepID=A0A1Y1CP80_9BACT|nr:cation:proton antiporter family protein [Labilibaculum antarcticum]BAX82248.1 potassium transporter Kef [Labilibaculum antarcticum]
MDPVWLAIAFALGLLVKLIGLPPLVGYLIAGFTLKYFGAESDDLIRTISDMGITLLLFTIGLKLRIKDLLHKEVWGGASIHMLLVTLLMALILFGLSYTSLHIFTDFTWQQALIIGFALSFSSTIYAVKILEEKSELKSAYGVLSIGILIIQDIFAVFYIVLVAGKLPTIWAIGLPVLFVIIRPVLLLILDKIGHGEILVLYGFFLAFVVGAELFTVVGLKADLGALVVGILISNHKKAKELADSLMNFKDIFLIGFFLSIGLIGLPSLQMLTLAIVLALAINFKVILYFWVLTRFRVRARTSLFTSLTLANFSEFGLIVASIAVAKGLIPSDWLVSIAIAVATTFIISSPLNAKAHKIYYSLKDHLRKFETQKRLIYDKAFDIGNAEILVFGMGKLGLSVYDQLNKTYGRKVLGLDYNYDVVQQLKKDGKNIQQDDATDSEFWENIFEKPDSHKVRLVMLCMNDHKSNIFAVERLKATSFKGNIAAIARFDDERKQLEKMNVDAVYDIYSEAGYGFANHVCHQIDIGCTAS